MTSVPTVSDLYVSDNACDAAAGASEAPAGVDDSGGEAAVFEQATTATSASSGKAERKNRIAYGTMTSCEASAENGVNDAVRPNRSVPVTV